jgi:hypothetical protein
MTFSIHRLHECNQVHNQTGRRGTVFSEIMLKKIKHIFFKKYVNNQ